MTMKILPSATIILLLLTCVIKAQQQSELETICGLARGTIQGEECLVCLNAATCCPLDLDTFGVNCDTFCTTGVYQNLPQTVCDGSLACVSMGGTAIACDGSVQYTADSQLNFVLECGASGCTCQKATWDGNDCDSCVGVMDGYDCSNVNGPVKVPDINENNTSAVSPTANLTRWYLTDEDFLSQVSIMTLPEASQLAGIPVGAAIADGLPKLQDYVPSHYNMIVGENNMKWKKTLADGETLGDYNFSEADTMVDYAVSVGARVRGHALIWGRYRGNTYPEAVAAQVETSDDPNTTVMQLMKEHIETTCQHFDGRVAVWDVVNEHLDSLDPEQNIFYKQLGHDYVKKSFEFTKKVLPEGVDLVWNEALNDFSMDSPRIQLLLQMLQQYKDEGVPLDTLGVQGHSISKKWDLEQAKVFFDAVAAMGYSIELTEIDAPITIFMDNDQNDEQDPFQAQADYFQEIVNLCLKTGVCNGITFWGVDDVHTWYDWIFEGTKPNLPLILDETGNPKPNWLSVRQAFETMGSSSITPEEEATDAPATEQESETSGAVFARYVCVSWACFLAAGIAIF